MYLHHLPVLQTAQELLDDYPWLCLKCFVVRKFGILPLVIHVGQHSSEQRFETRVHPCHDKSIFAFLPYLAVVGMCWGSEGPGGLELCLKKKFCSRTIERGRGWKCQGAKECFFQNLKKLHEGEHFFCASEKNINIPKVFRYVTSDFLVLHTCFKITIFRLISVKFRERSCDYFSTSIYQLNIFYTQSSTI